MSLQGDKEEYSKAPMDREDAQMALDASNRLYQWVKSTDLDIPPQVSFDIGVLIGRLRLLERR